MLNIIAGEKALFTGVNERLFKRYVLAAVHWASVWGR